MKDYTGPHLGEATDSPEYREAVARAELMKQAQEQYIAKQREENLAAQGAPRPHLSPAKKVYSPAPRHRLNTSRPPPNSTPTGVRPIGRAGYITS